MSGGNRLLGVLGLFVLLAPPKEKLRGSFSLASPQIQFKRFFEECCEGVEAASTST